MSEICNYCEVDFDYHDHSHLACECLPKQIQLLEANLAACREELARIKWERDSLIGWQEKCGDLWILDIQTQDQLSAYKEALEFYADQQNYKYGMLGTAPIDHDFGQIARKALTPVQSPKSGEIK